MSSGCEVATFSTVAPAAGQVIVQTKEGELFEVDIALISQSKTFSKMYEDLNLADSEPFVFPIPAVTAPIFILVLKWCEDHVGVSEPVIEEDPTTRERIWFQLTDTEKAFFDVPIEQIAELLMAANYLDIKSLYLFGCQSIAALLKDKSADEVRQILKLEDDLTEEEKKNIRKENPW